MSDTSRTRRPPLAKRLVDTVWGWCWRLVAAGLILAAILLTVARLLLPFAAEYRAALEQRVETYLGTEVSIGALDIGWEGVLPRIRLTDVSIEPVGPLREAVSVEQAFVTVLPAWREGTPTVRVAGVSLLGLELRVRIDDRARVHAFGTVIDPAALVEGGAPASGEAAPAGAATMAALFRIGRLQLLDTTLVVTGPDARVTRWHDIELRLANAGTRHRLSLVVVPPPDWGERVEALLEFTGDLADLGHGQGRLFVEGEGLVLDAWSGLWPTAPLRAGSGQLDATLWSDWTDGRVARASMALAVTDLALEPPRGDHEVRFERIEARLHAWRPDDSQWQLDVGGLEVRRNGRDWSDAGLSFALEDSGNWRLAAKFARLGDVTAVARLLPLEAARQERLAAVMPVGEVHRLRLAVTEGGAFRLQTDFRDLGWSPTGKIPGMTGLDGRALLDSDGGHVALESSGVGFAAPELFRAPLQLAELSALLRVTPTDAGFTLNAPRVHASNADLTSRGRVRIEIAKGRAPLLDLHFEYRDGVAVATPAYLPARIMPAPVVSWLDQALRDGRVRQGSFILHGHANDFPFRGHEGVFDVRADVAGVTLHYADGWPAIDDLDGLLRFSGPGMTVRADRGTSRGVRLRHGLARIPDLREGRLTVEAAAHGPVDGMLDVVNESPLAQRFAPAFGGARGRGDATLELGLTVPVKDVDATEVDGRVIFDGARVEQPAYDLVFTGLDGEVRFTERSASIDGLTAYLRGRPLRLDAATRDGIAYFRATGDFALAELVPALADGPLGASEGRAAWDVVLQVPLATDATARLEAESDLRGTRIALPAPLGKPGAGARPARLEVPLTRARTHIARLRYGADTHVALELDGAGHELQVRRLGVAFGRPADLPGRPGIRVEGQLEQLELGPWFDGVDPGAEAEGTLSLVALDLRVRLLRFQQYRLSNAQLEGRRTDDDVWRLQVASNEATGSVDWPPGIGRQETVRARFDWIDFALLRGDPGDGASGGDMGGIELDHLPPLDLRIDRLKLADTTLQEVVLVAGAGGTGTNIHRLEFFTEHMAVEGQGMWRGGDRRMTQLRFTLRSGDFGGALTELGYPDTMAEGEGKVTFDLQWPTAPWQLRLGWLNGFAQIRIDDGVLLQVNPGAARLLGMFSMDALPFRTLLQKGLIFERIRGRVDFADGNAYTNNFRINSAIGDIRISGRTGLVAQDYDQRVRVDPDLGGSLPVLGFLSGGPVVGAAIAVVQGVMKKLGEEKQAQQVDYIVTGTWDNPKVEQAGGGGAESGRDRDAIPETPR